MAHIYAAPEQKKFEALVQEAAEAAFKEQAGGEIFQNEVSVTIFQFLPWPKNTTKKELARIESGLAAPTKKPDNSNVAKSVEDAMNKVVFKDDAQVTDLLVRKRFSDKPRISVMITELVEPELPIIAASPKEASTPGGAKNRDDDTSSKAVGGDAMVKRSQSSQPGKPTACGAASVLMCQNHDKKGGAWCVDCLPAQYADKSKRPKTMVVLGEKDV